eukprot:6527354-Prymnesium_polylepis.2
MLHADRNRQPWGSDGRKKERRRRKRLAQGSCGEGGSVKSIGGISGISASGSTSSPSAPPTVSWSIWRSRSTISLVGSTRAHRLPTQPAPRHREEHVFRFGRRGAGLAAREISARRLLDASGVLHLHRDLAHVEEGSPVLGIRVEDHLVRVERLLNLACVLPRHSLEEAHLKVLRVGFQRSIRVRLGELRLAGGRVGRRKQAAQVHVLALLRHARQVFDHLVGPRVCSHLVDGELRQGRRERHHARSVHDRDRAADAGMRRKRVRRKRKHGKLADRQHWDLTSRHGRVARPRARSEKDGSFRLQSFSSWDTTVGRRPSQEGARGWAPGSAAEWRPRSPSNPPTRGT